MKKTAIQTEKECEEELFFDQLNEIYKNLTNLGRINSRGYLKVRGKLKKYCKYVEISDKENFAE